MSTISGNSPRMSTFCSNCGSTLPASVNFCPKCGTSSPFYYSHAKSSPVDPTETPSSADTTKLKVPTNYSSLSHGMLDKNPYEPFNPYVLPPPPPRRIKFGLISIVLALIFIFASVSAFTLLLYRANYLSLSLVTSTNPGIAPLTPTPISPQGLYNQVTSSQPTLSNSLNTQTTAAWNENSTTNSHCLFTGGSYDVQIDQSNTVRYCFAQKTNFSDLALQVQMTVIHGDGGGLLFRDSNGQAYRFYVNSVGRYTLVLGSDTNGGEPKSPTYGTTSVVNTGTNQSNLLTIIAKSDMIYLYINKQYVASANNPAPHWGKIGVFAYDNTNPTEVTFKNLQAWAL